MRLIVLVGPPGSGKTTKALDFENQGFVRINQDSQGKYEHLMLFEKAMAAGIDIVVDRMNFNKKQRGAYLIPAKRLGYRTEILALYENEDTCLKRCVNRKEHATIKTQTDATKALDFFFKNFERPMDDEADIVMHSHGGSNKTPVIICDLDGTMCDISHRLHWVSAEVKNWPMFFAGIKNDKVNSWCKVTVSAVQNLTGHSVVYCSGRPSDYRWITENWLGDHGLGGLLLMRRQKDYRPDTVVKEILLDFEILTRHVPYIVIDDRPSVCRMWRSRGCVVLQCNDEEF